MVWLYIWLGVVAVTIIIEFVTVKLVSIWLSIGALIAMILASCGVRFEIQIPVMLAVSLACIFGLRKPTIKFLNRKEDKNK